MSTILKSLRKLEQEKEANRFSRPVANYKGPGSLDFLSGETSWFKNAWFRRSLVAIIIIGLGSSSIYFYKKSKNPTVIQADAGAHARHQPPVTSKRDPPKVPPRRSQQSPGKVSGDAPKERRINQSPVARSIPFNIDKKIPSRTPREKQTGTSNPVTGVVAPKSLRPPQKRAEITEENIPGKSTGRPEISRAPVSQTGAEELAKTTKAVNTSPTKDAESASEPNESKKKTANSYGDVEPLKDGRLKVNAIVWASLPEDRMAVVNSRILHEGDSVDSFILVAIRQDDVVVKESGGGMWRVLFGRP